MEPGLVGDRPGHMKELAGRSHAVALLPTAPAGTSVAFATSTAGESAAKLIELIMVSPAAKTSKWDMALRCCKPFCVRYGHRARSLAGETTEPWRRLVKTVGAREYA